MIDSDLQFAVIDKQWFLTDRTTNEVKHGPYVTPAAMIKARQDLARVDVNATAEKVSRTQQARRDYRESVGK